MAPSSKSLALEATLHAEVATGEYYSQGLRQLHGAYLLQQIVVINRCN